LSRCTSCEDKNACANDAANSQQHQVQRAKRSLQLSLLVLGSYLID
jgi:hypothetical protein